MLLQTLLHISAWEKDIWISHFHQQPIQNLLAEAVAKGETQDIILFLKVLGNAGHPTSIKPITKILPIHGTAAASLPMRVHADAIMALRNIAKKEPRMVNFQHHEIFKALIAFTYNVHTAFAFSSNLDPGSSSSALHGQGSSPRAPYACMHRVVWDKACNWLGDNSCQHCEDRGESAGSKLHLFSHEVPDQKHCRYPCLSVSALSDPHSSSSLSPDVCWCSSYMSLLQCCSLQRRCQNPEPKAEQTELPFQQSRPHGHLQ